MEEGPLSRHAYRVRCPRCEKFVKWGAQDELDQLQATDSNALRVSWNERNRKPEDPFAVYES